MIAKITYPDKIEYLQIQGIQRFAEDDEVSFLINVDGDTEYELTPFELLTPIFDDAQEIADWKSSAYITIEFMTDALVVIDSITYDGDEN